MGFVNCEIKEAVVSVDDQHSLCWHNQPRSNLKEMRTCFKGGDAIAVINKKISAVSKFIA